MDTAPPDWRSGVSFLLERVGVNRVKGFEGPYGEA